MNSCPHPRPPPQGKRSRKDAIRAKGAHSLWIPCLPLGGQERHRLPYVASGGVQSSSRGLLAIRDHGVHLDFWSAPPQTLDWLAGFTSVAWRLWVYPQGHPLPAHLPSARHPRVLACVRQPPLGKRKSQIPWPTSSCPYDVD